MPDANARYMFVIGIGMKCSMHSVGLLNLYFELTIQQVLPIITVACYESLAEATLRVIRCCLLTLSSIILTDWLPRCHDMPAQISVLATLSMQTRPAYRLKYTGDCIVKSIWCAS